MCSRRSTTRTRRPEAASRSAITDPAKPAPTTSASYTSAPSAVRPRELMRRGSSEGAARRPVQVRAERGGELRRQVREVLVDEQAADDRVAAAAVADEAVEVDQAHAAAHPA